MKKFKYYLRDNCKYFSFILSRLHINKSKNKILFDKIKQYKDLHINKTCYILGTGPSLKKVNIRKLENEFVIGTNFVFLHSDFKFLKRTYICFAPSHQPLNFDVWYNLFNKINKLNISQLFIGDSKYKYSIGNFLKENNYEKFQNLTLLNYHYSPILNSKNINFSNFHNLSLGPLISPVTTLVTTLQIAYFMGFKKIRLMGFDHDILDSYLQKGNSNSHFYADDQNHETNDMYKTKTRIFNWLFNAWTQYEILNDFYKNDNIEIVNYNKESFLDVFDKVI